MHESEIPWIDVRERGGRGPDGEPQFLDRRLFFQFLAFEVGEGATPDAAVTELGSKLAARKVGAVLYADVNHPRGLGLLTWSEDPATFVRDVRPSVLEVSVPLRARTELTRTKSSSSSR